MVALVPVKAGFASSLLQFDTRGCLPPTVQHDLLVPGESVPQQPKSAQDWEKEREKLRLLGIIGLAALLLRWLFGS